MAAQSSTPSTGIRARIQPWVQAARPAAHPIIFAPLLIGQVLAIHAHQQFSAVLFLHTLLFGVLYQVHLLYLNDYADAAIDKTNAQYWLSGGSRVLPDGKLRRRDLLVGANAALVVMVGYAFLLVVFLERPWMIVAMAMAVGLSWAYNMRPLQLSYRGHGEIVQGLGCGILLPLIGFYMQQGSLQGFSFSVLIPLYLMFYASNIITALPDYQSDKDGHKRTYPVRHGQRRARTTAMLLLGLAHVGVILVSFDVSPISLAIVAIPSSLILAAIIQSGMLEKADVAAFAICKKFVTWASVSQAWLLFAWIGALLMESTS